MPEGCFPNGCSDFRTLIRAFVRNFERGDLSTVYKTTVNQLLICEFRAGTARAVKDEALSMPETNIHPLETIK